jgi:hydroxyacylglutathione hydrolase
MLFERIESKGLAHSSYLVGDGYDALVIDPRRDCDIYEQIAQSEGMSIRHILETHRNEDYVVGSMELAARTRAQVWHADDQMDYLYGAAAAKGQIWAIGALRLEALFTPGHTPGALSYLLYNAEGEPWAVFTGDTLFAGDVGRVDLLGPDHMGEMANALYSSLFGQLLLLGDGVLVCPAHGAGSVCGNSIADRPVTTIGYERQHNPKLQYRERSEFVAQVAQEMERPPYFGRTETWNLYGAPLLGPLPRPNPLSPSEFAAKMGDAVIVDTRDEMAFGAAHIPGALSIWLGGLARFAGWFLPYDRPLLLVAHDKDIEDATRTLIRLGYDNIEGYLSGGMHAWHASGKESDSIDMTTSAALLHRPVQGREEWILDVRNKGELESDGEIPGAHHIHITQLPDHLLDVPQHRPIQVFCASGHRAMIAGSLLKSHGRDQVTVVLGGTDGMASTTQ